MRVPASLLRPMKVWGIGVWVLGLAACGGQPLVAPELMAKPRLSAAELQRMDEETLEQRRADFARQRDQAAADFRQAESQCWKQFAVNRCLDNAAQTRRALLDQLSADDRVVQDELRQRKLQRADERLQGKQEKAAQ